MTRSPRSSEDWRDLAACKGKPLDMFFPKMPKHWATIDAKAKYRQDVAAAKAVCNACPVRGACLDMALQTHTQHGIFGGLTTKERTRVRLERELPSGGNHPRVMRHGSRPAYLSGCRCEACVEWNRARLRRAEERKEAS